MHLNISKESAISVRPVHVVIRVAVNKKAGESGVSVDVQHHVQLIFA